MPKRKGNEESKGAEVQEVKDAAPSSPKRARAKAVEPTPSTPPRSPAKFTLNFSPTASPTRERDQKSGGLFRSRSASKLSQLVRSGSKMKLNQAPIDFSETILENDFSLSSHIVPPNAYVNERNGGILGEGMVLKSDYVPGLSCNLDFHVSGAPNFRGVPGQPIFGVGQPSISGIRTVLNLLNRGGGVKRPKTYWVNLREEPVVYLNNRPFVLREFDYPFRNLVDFAGIDPKRLSQIESRLKNDISSEAAANYGNILVHDEVELGAVRPCWESVNCEGAVLSSGQVYEKLSAEGYDVEYVRIPITAESTFSATQFDSIVRVYMDAMKKDPNTFFIFNCQMGRGRSTLAMVIMSLLLDCVSMRIPAVPSFSLDDADDSHANSKESRFQHGEYNIIKKLIRVLPNGVSNKSTVDDTIDQCGMVQNIREVIMEALSRREHEVGEAFKMYGQRTTDKLKRYFWLICFEAFLQSTSSHALGTAEATFQDWIKSNPVIETMGTELIEELIDDLVQDVPSEKELAALPEDQQIVYSRTGSVLGSGCIIKRHYVTAESLKIASQARKGQPAFRHVTDLPLSATGQPTLEGIGEILEICKQRSRRDLHPEGKVVWVALREEPVVYIGKSACLLRDYSHPFHILNEFQSGISSERVDDVTKRFQSDILAEANKEETHRLMIHHQPSPNEICGEWSDVDLSKIKTFEEVLSEHKGVDCLRLPIQTAKGLSLATFDTLYRTIMEQPDGVHFVFSCRTGKRRSTVALIAATLVMMHSGKVKKSVFENTDMEPLAKPSLRRKNSNYDLKEEEKAKEGARRARYGRGEYKGILGLIRVLRRGGKIKEDVDKATDWCGELYNVRDAIGEARMQIDSDRKTTKFSHKYAAHCLINYASLITFNAYLTERKKAEIDANWDANISSNSSSSNAFTFPSFSSWVEGRPELVKAFEELNHPDALTASTPLADELYASIYEKRNWNVLVRNSILKSDYFVGCKNPAVDQYIDGTINFRMLNNFPVAGTGIPTYQGMCNTLAYLFQSDNKMFNGRVPPMQATATLWMNLREEPVLYINRKPFVLRNYDSPYRNLEHTGISGKRLEAMEKQLKYDTLQEAMLFNGQVLLHDEDENGNCMSYWEAVTEDSLLTSKEIFERVFSRIRPRSLTTELDSQRAWYFRTPITDEQAPTPEAVDLFISHLENPANGAQFANRVCIFNCQMGRGRTTTGMVVACLWYLHRASHFCEESKASLDSGDAGAPNPSSGLNVMTTPDNDGGSEEPTEGEDKQEEDDEDDATKLLREKLLKKGWYRCVRLLTRVLANGRAVKQQVDLVVDRCSAMQNLREGIYDTQVFAEGALKRKQPFYLQRAKDYLVRYFFLIVINAYFIDCSQTKRREKSFSHWLQDRPEISNLVTNVELVTHTKVRVVKDTKA